MANEKPVYTPSDDIDIQFRSTRKYQGLSIVTRKRTRTLQIYENEGIKWEGPELTARRNGFNFIRAKIRLDFNSSTAINGNIYISGRGDRFHYLLGIGKDSKDIFFIVGIHIEKPILRPVPGFT